MNRIIPPANAQYRIDTLDNGGEIAVTDLPHVQIECTIDGAEIVETREVSKDEHDKVASSNTEGS